MGRLLLAGAAALVAPARLLAEACRRLVATDAGPFYPVGSIPETDDLLSGAGGEAPGTVLYLVGRVLDASCRPLAGATVEIWQCDAGGQYDHPRAPRRKPLERGFLYSARVRSDEDGGFRFRTLRPASYEAFGLRRAPHIHVRVAAPGHPVLVTEVYFAGGADDELRRGDRVFLGRGPRRGELVAALRPAGEAGERLGRPPEAGALVCVHDLTLPA